MLQGHCLLRAIPQYASLLVRTLVLVTRRNFKMPRFKDQRYAIKFCVALKKTGAETVAMLREAYGDNTMYQNMVYSWHKMFREGREDAEIAITWRLHHDNAPSHTAFIVTEYLAKRSVATLPQPPYSPAGLLYFLEDQEGTQRPPFRDFGSRQRSDDEVLEGGPS